MSDDQWKQCDTKCVACGFAMRWRLVDEADDGTEDTEYKCQNPRCGRTERVVDEADS